MTVASDPRRITTLKNVVNVETDIESSVFVSAHQLTVTKAHRVDQSVPYHAIATHGDIAPKA